MKTPETLLIIGAAALGVYALSKQEGSPLEGITNIIEAPGDGGGLLPDINFPAFNFPAFNFPAINFPAWPDFNLPSADALPVISDIGLPELPGLPTIPGAEGIGQKLGGYLAGGVKSGILGFGQGIWDVGAEERAGYSAFAEAAAEPTWMPFGRIIAGFKAMANTMAGGGSLGGVSPGTGVTEHIGDPFAQEAAIHAGIAAGTLTPGGMPIESAATKPGATAPDPQGEASAKEPEAALTDKQKLQASWSG